MPTGINLPLGKSQASLVPPLCLLAAQHCLLLYFFSCFLYLAVTSHIAQQILWITGHLSCDCSAPLGLAHQRLCNTQYREAGKAWLSDPSPFSCLAGNEVPSKEHHELKPYIHHLHVIDNQQALFELSHRIEPRVWAYTASYNLVTAALWIKWMFMPSMLLPSIRTVYWVLSVAHTTCTGRSGKSQKRSYSQSCRASLVPSPLVTRTGWSGAASFELMNLVSVEVLFGPV